MRLGLTIVAKRTIRGDAYVLGIAKVILGKKGVGFDLVHCLAKGTICGVPCQERTHDVLVQRPSQR